MPHPVFTYTSKTLLILALLFTPIAPTIGVLFLSYYGYFPVIFWGGGSARSFIFSGYCLLLFCVLLNVFLALWLIKKLPKKWRPDFSFLRRVALISLLVFAGLNGYVFKRTSFSPVFLYEPLIGFVGARAKGNDDSLSDEEAFGHRLRDYTLQKMAQRFDVSEQGYVIDEQQKLMWQRCLQGQVWQAGICVGDTETMEY